MADLEVFNIIVGPVLEGVVAEVTGLKDVDGKVTSTRVAFVIVATPLEGGSISSLTRRGRDLREQSLPRHICSVGLLVVE